ncbi:mammalian cell entry protein [Williamsia sp. 1138]|uniref:MCE family protein n=1 Tax=Williamsia sp. 1138 TaxID=1903117 RepID=UPI000A10775D|nr:MlaD family protein [Williamsia sp. 1138]OZG28872.1 mammalian cell entry protein [Williamsia sp. 1138]
MQLSRFIRIQLVIFSALTMVAVVTMAVKYLQVPTLAGWGTYTVRAEFTSTGGLYPTANITYRGTQIGKVEKIDITPSGVQATMKLSSDTPVPADLNADVHSRSAIGEQFIDLVPRNDNEPYLRDGDLIGLDRTSVPQEVGPLIDTVNTSLDALPRDQLQTVVDESYLAFNNAGPTWQRLLDSTHAVVEDAATNLQPITGLIDGAAPLLGAIEASDPAIRQWSGNVKSLTGQLAGSDATVRHLITSGKPALDESTKLFQQLKPTAPILLANLVSLGQVAVTYNASLEQLLVILPLGAAAMDTITYPNRSGNKAGYLSFNLNLNLPEPCTVGFLPASERRSAAAVDSPVRTPESLYCALPQDDQNASRGARNYPCMDKPGKRAPTVDICKSDQTYKPVGTNPWIGDPRPYVDNPLYDQLASTVAGGRPAGAPAVGTASYDPATGSYVGSDGKSYKQADVATNDDPNRKETSWQTMMTPQS